MHKCCIVCEDHVWVQRERPVRKSEGSRCSRSIVSPDPPQPPTGQEAPHCESVCVSLMLGLAITAGKHQRVSAFLFCPPPPPSPPLSAVAQPHVSPPAPHISPRSHHSLLWGTWSRVHCCCRVLVVWVLNDVHHRFLLLLLLPLPMSPPPVFWVREEEAFPSIAPVTTGYCTQPPHAVQEVCSEGTHVDVHENHIKIYSLIFLYRKRECVFKVSTLLVIKRRCFPFV